MRGTTKKAKSLPKAKRFIFRLNSDTGYFDRIEGDESFTKIPSELRIENTVRTDQIHSKVICRGRTKNNSLAFFTGIIPLENSFYYGDHLDVNASKSKKRSFILFHLSESNTILMIFFFNQYEVFPHRRRKFSNEFIQSLNQ